MFKLYPILSAPGNCQFKKSRDVGSNAISSHHIEPRSCVNTIHPPSPFNCSGLLSSSHSLPRQRRPSTLGRPVPTSVGRCRPHPAFEWLDPFPWGFHTYSSNLISTCSVHCSSLHLSHLFFNKPLHFLFLRQFQLIFGNEELIIHSCKGVFDERMVFLSA